MAVRTRLTAARGRLQLSAGSARRLGARSDPEPVGLDGEREALAVADDLASSAAGGHRHGQSCLDRSSSARVQHQASGPVACDRPDGHPLGSLVADPRIEPRDRRGHPPGVDFGSGVAAQAAAVR